MILVKKLKFIHRFFLNKVAQEKMFGGVLDRKLALLDNKNTDSRTLQNLHFTKWVSPWLWSF